MTEMSDGFYIYEWVKFDPKRDYIFDMDGGDTLADTERYLSQIYAGFQSLLENIYIPGGGVALTRKDLEEFAKISQEVVKKSFEGFTFDMSESENALSQNVGKMMTDFDSLVKNSIETLKTSAKLDFDIKRKEIVQNQKEYDNLFKNNTEKVEKAFDNLAQFMDTWQDSHKKSTSNNDAERTKSRDDNMAKMQTLFDDLSQFMDTVKGEINDNLENNNKLKDFKNNIKKLTENS